jgi:hypothetical protein
MNANAYTHTPARTYTRAPRPAPPPLPTHTEPVSLHLFITTCFPGKASDTMLQIRAVLGLLSRTIFSNRGFVDYLCGPPAVNTAISVVYADTHIKIRCMT